MLIWKAWDVQLRCQILACFTIMRQFIECYHVRETQSPCSTRLIFFVFSSEPAVTCECWKSRRRLKENSKVFLGSHLLSSECNWEVTVARNGGRQDMVWKTKNTSEGTAHRVEIKSECLFDCKTVLNLSNSGVVVHCWNFSCTKIVFMEEWSKEIPSCISTKSSIWSLIKNILTSLMLLRNKSCGPMRIKWNSLNKGYKFHIQSPIPTVRYTGWIHHAWWVAASGTGNIEVGQEWI